MRYRVLGRTGIEVSTYCLGTMMFGAVGNSDHDDCVRIIHAALDQGINFVDTADMYSAGESEEIVGKALRGRRNDWIDLYQVHRPDHSTDIEETLSVLTDLVQAGKIRAFGSSTFPAEDIVDAYYVAERRGLARFRTEQSPYSILARGIEASVLPVCQRYGMGVLTWSPLAWGFLAGKYRKGQPVDLSAGRPAMMPARFDPSIPANAAKFDAVEDLVRLADEIGCTLPELAVAFTGTHQGVTSTIIGPRTLDQLDGLLKGAALTLDDATLDRIDEIVPPGTNLYHPDGAWRPPILDDALRRRRPLSERAASS